MYVPMTTLTGKDFVIDSSNVHNIITKFIVRNDESEAKIQVLIPQFNGSLDFIELQEYCEGVLVHSIWAPKTEGILIVLFYSGRRNPTYGGKSLKES